MWVHRPDEQLGPVRSLNFSPLFPSQTQSIVTTITTLAVLKLRSSHVLYFVAGSLCTSFTGKNRILGYLLLLSVFWTLVYPEIVDLLLNQTFLDLCCTAKGLKLIIKQPRPEGSSIVKTHGMPSTHSAWVYPLLSTTFLQSLGSRVKLTKDYQRRREQFFSLGFPFPRWHLPLLPLLSQNHDFHGNLFLPLITSTSLSSINSTLSILWTSPSFNSNLPWTLNSNPRNLVKDQIRSSYKVTMSCWIHFRIGLGFHTFLGLEWIREFELRGRGRVGEFERNWIDWEWHWN